MAKQPYDTDIFNQFDRNFGLDRDDQHKRDKIELDLLHDCPHYCAFNLKGEFILYSKVDNTTDTDVRRNRKLHFDNFYRKIIWIYSTQKENEWICKGIHKIPNNFELISISKYDNKLYLYSNHYFYEWNMLTQKSIRIFTIKNMMKEN